jgi:tetratricopeptide (TPR) repeat protein
MNNLYKYLLKLLLLLLASTASAQIKKGIGDIVTTEKKNTGITHALIIGVSKYKEESINLTYADKDAILFRDFLIKSGTVKKENIFSLMNQEATGVAINTSIESLAQKSKPNDTVFIYFSGHGDVQTNPKTKKSTGYLLGHNANANRVYKGNGGFLELSYLQKLIDAMALKNVKVNLILDACHSSHIINEEGAKSLSTIAAGSFKNTIKYLSCLDTEKSYEDKVIGQGYFTFYLIKGLMGMADNQPKDNKITYNELSQYLMMEVYNASNERQSPRIEFHSPFSVVQYVKPEFLEVAIKSSRATQIAQYITAAKGIKTESYGSLKLSLKEKKFITLVNKHFLNKKDGLNKVYKLFENGTYKTQLGNEQQKIFKNKLADALSKYPQDAVNNIFLGTLNLPKANYFREAAIECNKLIKLLDTGSYMYNIYKIYDKYLQAYAILREKNYKLYNYADSLLNEAIKLQPEAAFIKHGLGLVAEYREQYTEAEDYYRQAIDLVPTWVFPRNSLGNVLRDQGKYLEAIKVLGEVMKMNPKFSWSYNNLGNIYFDMGNYSIAENYYLKAIELNPKEGSIPLGNLGVMYKDRGNFREAEKYINKAIAVDKNNVEALILLGDLYSSGGSTNSDLALKSLNKAIKIEPYYSATYTALANFYKDNNVNENDVLKADSLYAIATKNNPYDTWAHAGRGWNIIDKDTLKAIEYFKNNLKFSPNQPSTYYYLGAAHEYLKDTVSAIKYQLKAISINPYYYDPYTELVNIYIKQKDTSKAINILSNGKEYLKQNPQYYYDLGNLYFSINQDSTALKHYNTALNVDTAFAKANSAIAYLALQNGNTNIAVKQIKKAIENNPPSYNLKDFEANYLAHLDKLIVQNKLNEVLNDINIFNKTFTTRKATNYHEALTFYLKGELELSKNLIAKAIKNNNYDLDRYIELNAWILLDQGKYELAKKEFERLSSNEFHQLFTLLLSTWLNNDSTKIDIQKLEILNAQWKTDVQNLENLSQKSRELVKRFIINH